MKQIKIRHGALESKFRRRPIEVQGDRVGKMEREASMEKFEHQVDSVE